VVQHCSLKFTCISSWCLAHLTRHIPFVHKYPHICTFMWQMETQPAWQLSLLIRLYDMIRWGQCGCGCVFCLCFTDTTRCVCICRLAVTTWLTNEYDAWVPVITDSEKPTYPDRNYLSANFFTVNTNCTGLEKNVSIHSVHPSTNRLRITDRPTAFSNVTLQATSISNRTCTPWTAKWPHTCSLKTRFYLDGSERQRQTLV